MSLAYNSHADHLSGRVNFGWITESWQLFMANAGVWIVAALVSMGVPLVLGGIFMAWMMAVIGPNTFTPQSQPPPFPSGKQITSLHTLFSMFGLPPQFTQIISAEIVLGLIMLVYYAYLYGGLFRMAVRQVRGLPIEYRDIFRGGPLFGRMLGAMLLLGLGCYGLELIVESPVFLLLWLRPKDTVAIVVTVTLLGVALMFLFLALAGLLLPAFALMADGEGVFSALRRSIRAMKGQWLPATGFVFVMGLLVYASEIPCGLGLLATIPMAFLITALAYRDLVGMPNMAAPPAPTYAPHTPGIWPPPPQSAPTPPAERPE